MDDRNLGAKTNVIRSLSRREWVQRMLAGTGAGLAAPALAGARSSHGQLVTISTPQAAPKEHAADWKPEFFDDDQNTAIVALSEKILPGSTDLQVNRFIDLVIGAEIPEVQIKFVTSLNALQGESMRQFTKAFENLTSEQQDAVLTTASTTKSTDPSFSGPADPTAHPALPNLRDYFEFFKGWVSTSYYSTEAGMKELGWTGENFFESLPGCPHPKAAIPDRDRFDRGGRQWQN